VHTDRQLTLKPTDYRFVAVDASGLDPRDQPDLPPVITEDELRHLPAGVRAEVFEPLDAREVTWYPAHTTIRFWTWGDVECCLPAGATSATLRDTWTSAGGPQHDDHDHDDHDEDEDEHERHHRPPRPRGRLLRLAPGDLLVIEEVLGPQT